jgi:multidrug efflux pump subunit AcrA (membrane-fusion protein)
MSNVALIRNRALTLLGCAALLVSATSAVRSADDATPTTPVVVTGITKPSEERRLSFGGPGLVADVSVKEGDTVTKKQILASQDSRQEEFALKSDEREANSQEKIDYSKADFDLKSVVYKRKLKLLTDFQGASQSEVEEAELAVKLAAAQIALAQLEHDQKGWDADKERAKIDQMKMTSPIDGIVEKINIGAGEMADPQSKDGSILVGQWNPLWLEAHLPSAQASQLKLNQELPVKYDGGDWQTAKIIFFEKVDAASDTEMVRLELANPNSAKLPGLHMQIKLPENVTSVAASDSK